MGRYIQCPNCDKRKLHHAKGLCHACYMREYGEDRSQGFCKSCLELEELVGRGLCRECYDYHRHNNTLDTFSKIEPEPPGI